MITQLAWTLRQDPSIEAFEVTIGDQPLTLPGGDTQVQRGPRLGVRPRPRPGQLAAVRAPRRGARSGAAGRPLRSTGPFGRPGLDLGRDRASASPRARWPSVSADGTRCWSPRSRPRARSARSSSGGTDLLRPAWDFADRMWLVDRTSAGARVSYVRGTTIHPLTVAGVTGRDVSTVPGLARRHPAGRGRAGPRADHLVVSRIRHDDRAACSAPPGPGASPGTTPTCSGSATSAGARRPASRCCTC